MSTLVPSNERIVRGWLLCLAALVAAKTIAYFIDPAARFFMGDSGTYLHTALTGWIPPDRSFLYGWLVGATALATESIDVLLWLQAGFGIVSALLLYAWLRQAASASRGAALVAATLFALEPAQLFYERMLMAEATGFLCFALFFTTLSLHVARGGPWWIPFYAVFGVAVVALRISLLPVVLVLSLLAPWLWLWSRPAQGLARLPRFALLAFNVALAVGCTLGAHRGYQQWYGVLAEKDPGYSAVTGMFRLGLVAPLVEKHHLEHSGVPAHALDEVTLDYRSRHLREAQIWSEGGLYDVVRRHADDPERAARKISIKAARDNPLGLLQLGLSTVGDYFVAGIAGPRLQDDLGYRAPDAGMIDALQRHFGYDARGIHARATPAHRWLELGATWLTFCLVALAPLALVALYLGWSRPRRELRLLLALTSIGLVAGHVLFSHIVSFRYLHPLPWFVLANMVLVLQAWPYRRSATPPQPL